LKKKGNLHEDLEYNGDPKSVAHLSIEEREAMTQRLMKKFRSMGLKAGPSLTANG
jgi:hypothetical protein